MANKLIINDKVIIISGKNKGKIGFIKKIFKNNKVIIKDINLVIKHQKPNPNLSKLGGLIKKESPIHISNIAIYNKKTNKQDKIGFKFLKKKKIRYLKSNNKII